MDNEDIARAIQANKDLSERNQARIVKLENEQKEFRDLVTAVNGMVVEQKNMRHDLTEMKGDLKQIKEKPGKMWDSAVNKVVMIILAAVVTFMLAKIGL